MKYIFIAEAKYLCFFLRLILIFFSNFVLPICNFFLQACSTFIKFLDALASLRPILFSECFFLDSRYSSEYISENVIGLCQYHQYQC